LQVDKALLEHEQALLEMANTALVAVAALLVMTVNMILVVGCVVYKGRKKQRDAYHDFKQNLVCFSEPSPSTLNSQPLTLTTLNPEP
jgi:hypothetical protein